MDELDLQDTPARIVAVSSVAHTFGTIVLEDLHYKNRSYGAWTSYGQSKLANILFVKELARRSSTFHFVLQIFLP